jgi:uncharacterized protein YqgC (DUF456 family)
VEPLWFLLALGVMLLGVAGTFVPLVPGLPLVLGGIYVYAIATQLDGGLGAGHLAAFTVVGLVAYGFGFAANALGARAAGGSRAGAIGAVLGLLVGLVLGGPVGLILGPFVGAVLGESLWGTRGRQALRSGLGAALGLLAGTVVEFAVALGLTAAFVFTVLAAG